MLGIKSGEVRASDAIGLASAAAVGRKRGPSRRSALPEEGPAARGTRATARVRVVGP